MCSRNPKFSTYVPDDIVFSILSKLPLKSVSRFTCAHKSWALLFENPIFINMFYKNMVSKYQSLEDEEKCVLINHFDSTNWQWKSHVFSERFEIKMKVNWSHPFQPNPYGPSSPSTLVSYPDGTLCIYDQYRSDIALWNHVTEELNIVHRSIPVRDNNPLGFHNYSVIHGFGYDQIKDDYKIIQYVNRFWNDKSHYPLWEIYSLKKESWRTLYLVDMPTRESSVGSMLSLNGVCHWWGYTGEEPYVVSFNLNTERHVTTLLPKNMHDPKTFMNRRLILLNGHVAVISQHVIAIEFNSFHVSIAILGEFGVKESWIKLFDFRPLPNMYYPIGASKKGDLLFIDKDELISYDLTTGIIENIDLKKDIKDVLNDIHAHMVVYKKDIL